MGLTKFFQNVWKQTRAYGSVFKIQRARLTWTKKSRVATAARTQSHGHHRQSDYPTWRAFQSDNLTQGSWSSSQTIQSATRKPSGSNTDLPLSEPMLFWFLIKSNLDKNYKLSAQNISTLFTYHLFCFVILSLSLSVSHPLPNRFMKLPFPLLKLFDFLCENVLPLSLFDCPYLILFTWLCIWN